MIDQQQMRAIAFLAAKMRPSGATPWDEPGIIVALAKVAHLSLAEVVMATTRAAANPEAKTPGVIPVTGGEHWREKAAASTHPFPPKANEQCPRHHGQWATNCGGCAVDARAADEPATPPPAWEPASDTTRTAALAACRAQLHPDDSRDRGEEDTDA